MRSWTSIAAFEGIDLANSYILNWARDDAKLTFEMDFVLTKDHPAYTPPPSGDWACFRRGTLTFKRPLAISGLPPVIQVPSAIDANQERDYGHMDALVEIEPGLYELSGDFGVARVQSDEPRADVAENGV